MALDRPKVLVCDDSSTIRRLVCALLREQYQTLAVESAEKALEKAPDFQPDLILTDLLMDGMDGFELCRRVRAHPLLRKVPVVVLTTRADHESRAEGLEIGADDYLFKPIHPRELLARVAALVRFHRSKQAEEELLDKTLRGSIKVLSDLLSFTNPQAFGRATRARKHALALCSKLDLLEVWDLEVAAMLSQIGCVTLPPHTAQKLYFGQSLLEGERQMVDRLPQVTEELLANIPRLEGVREILAAADRRFDGTAGHGAGTGEEIPLGARMIKLIVDYDVLEAQGLAVDKAFEVLRRRPGAYDPGLLESFATVCGAARGSERVLELPLSALEPRMVLAGDVYTGHGMLLASRGQEMTAPLIQRLKNYAPNLGVREPIQVLALLPSRS